MCTPAKSYCGTCCVTVIAKPDLPSRSAKKQEFTGALAAVSVGCSHRLSRVGLFMPLPRLRRWLDRCDPATLIARDVGERWDGGGNVEMWEKGRGRGMCKTAPHSPTCMMMRTALSKSLGVPRSSQAQAVWGSEVPAVAREVRLSSESSWH